MFRKRWYVLDFQSNCKTMFNSWWNSKSFKADIFLFNLIEFQNWFFLFVAFIDFFPTLFFEVVKIDFEFFIKESYSKVSSQSSGVDGKKILNSLLHSCEKWKNYVAPGQARTADIRIAHTVYKYGALTDWATGAHIHWLAKYGLSSVKISKNRKTKNWILRVLILPIGYWSQIF